MPVHPLLECPALIGAIGPVYRAVMCLSFTYWLTGCRGVPNDQTNMAALIRVPQAHIGPIKPAIDAAISELFPILKAEYEAAFKSKAARIAIAKIGNRAFNAKRKAATHSAKQFSNSTIATRIQPVKTAFQGDERTDHHARQAAAARDTRGRTQARAQVGTQASAQAGAQAGGLLTDARGGSPTPRVAPPDDGSDRD